MKRLLLLLTITLTFTLYNHAQVPQSERNALIAFYNSTNGPNWTNNTNWNTSNPVSSWFGVTTTTTGLDGQPHPDGLEHVNGITFFADNNINGTLPSQLGDLTYFRALIVRQSNISGEFPAEIWTLQDMLQIQMIDSEMSGNISPSIQNLQNLQVLDIRGSNFSGNIPDLTVIPNLQFLNIQNNNFQFGDFENEHSSYQANMGSQYSFVPQKKISMDETTVADIGDSVTFEAICSGSQNSYQWYFNDTLIDGQTNPSITIGNVQPSEFATYRCDITSPLAHPLTLQTGDFVLGQNPLTHPDYNALVTFYNATNGNNWTNSTNWLDITKPISTWFGITEENGRVVDLFLNNNNVGGTIPPEIGNLANIKRIILGTNTINGTIPVEFGNLSDLEFLNLNTNNLTGQIPVEFENLSSLNRLYLYTNNLDGTIPQGLANLTNLEQLLLSNNNFSGTIPDFSGNSLLDFLWIQSNNFQFGDFENEFPSYLANITNFIYSPQNPNIVNPNNFLINFGDDVSLVSAPISGSSNEYTWYLNAQVVANATNPTLDLNNIQENQFGTYQCVVTNPIVSGLSILAGTFEVGLDPISSPDYPALVALYSSLNGQFWTNSTNWLDTTKPISTWFGITETNGRVTDINLGFNNNVSGSIPTELTDLTELQTFWIQGSYVSGEIPSNIGDLANLRQLVLYNTGNISGNIPTSIQNCTNLEWLYLTGNQFENTVPDLTGLSNLAILTIENNKFEFGDFENEFTTYQANTSLSYSPQGLVDEPNSVAVEIGNSTTLTSNLSGSQNNYQWYKDAVVLSGEINPTLNITISSAADYGNYYYTATSNIVTGLVLQSQNFTVGEPPTINLDYNSLIALYNSTNGDTWTTNTNWLDNSKPLNTWHGVVLNNNRVVELNLGNNNLTGSLPTEIGNFSELESLQLYSNQISGVIPPEIGNLTSLTQLDLSPNIFTGTIPPEIGNLINLEILWLNQNGLTGNIPSTFQNLINLQQLHLLGSAGPPYSSSTYSGDFPDLTGLPLFVLDIRRNNFTFSDISDEFATYVANIQFFDYAPQYTIDAPVTIEGNPGDDITLTLTNPVSNRLGSTDDALAQNQYQWYKDNVAIPNANADTYTITNAQVSDNGEYYCEITNPDVPNMVILREIITLNLGTLSVKETNLDTAIIYPNPVGQQLHIKLNTNNKANASIYDIRGRLVFKQRLTSKASTLNIVSLQSGMYLLKINTNNKTTTKRFIKH